MRLLPFSGIKVTEPSLEALKGLLPFGGTKVTKPSFETSKGLLPFGGAKITKHSFEASKQGERESSLPSGRDFFSVKTAFCLRILLFSLLSFVLIDQRQLGVGGLRSSFLDLPFLPSSVWVVLGAELGCCRPTGASFDQLPEAFGAVGVCRAGLRSATAGIGSGCSSSIYL
ncbi:hypothetical protein ACOSQ3_027000 [Xanthoceras sorbifolium]